MNQSINGPINVARIEKDNKVLHFFMDYHENVEQQTVCEDIRSKDISKFFMDDVFDKATSQDPIHFFIESVPMYHEKGAGKTEGRYADRVINLLLKTFNIKSKGDDIYTSNTFKNVTLHYVDIRPYIFTEIDELFAKLLEFRKFIWMKKNINNDVVN